MIYVFLNDQQKKNENFLMFCIQNNPFIIKFSKICKIKNIDLIKKCMFKNGAII
jgi:hypothetical protein